MSFLQKAMKLKEQAINAAMNYTEMEAKVREATNGEEPWGPHGSVMADISQGTFSYDDFPEVMGMLWKRLLKDTEGKYWRRIYKSLLLLHYLISNGSERCVEEARDRVYDLRKLERFTFIDAKGKDQGVNVAHKTKEIINILNDDEELRELRKKAKANKDKYTGIGSGDKMKRGNSNSDWSNEKAGFEDDWNSQTQKKSSSSRYTDEDDEKSNTDTGGFARLDAEAEDDDFAPRSQAPAQPAAVVAAPQSSGGLLDLLGSPTPAPAAASSGGDWGAFGSAPAPASSGDPFGAPAAGGDAFGSFTAAPTPAAPAGGDAFGSFTAAPQQAASGAGDFGSFSSAPTPTPNAGLGGLGMMGMQQQQQQQPAMGMQQQPMGMGMGMGMQQPMGAGMQQQQQPMGMGMGMPQMAPMQAQPSANLMGDLMGGGTLAPAAAKKPAAKPNFGGLDINLDNLSLSNPKTAGATKPKGNTSVFGDSLDSASAASNSNAGSMGGGMGGGMMGGMQQQQQPMGMMNQGGMGMMNQGMGMQGGMGMQNQGMMNQGMGMQNQGMGMQNQGMGMQGGMMNQGMMQQNMMGQQQQQQGGMMGNQMYGNNMMQGRR